MTQNASNGSFSAAHQVLTSPPLLERIFTWILEDQQGTWPVPEEPKSPHQEEDPACITSGGVLLRCAQVCQQWHHEATRLLWRDWTNNYTFTETFEKIEPARRQFYADLIHTADLTLVEDGRLFQTVQTIFEHITFSNLRSLHLYVPGSSRYPCDKVELHIFHAPRLTTLSIDPQYDWLPVSYSVFQDEWTVLFELIAVSSDIFSRYARKSTKEAAGPLSAYREYRVRG